MPQINETERALMALLQKERQRNGSVQAAEPALPEIDMTMFLSPTAQREVAAMQNIPQITLPLVSQDIRASRLELDLQLLQSPTAPSGEIDLSSGWDIDESDLEPSNNRYASTEVAPDLANLFMDRALQETGGGSGAAQRRAERLGSLDFSFAENDMVVEPRMYEAPAQRSSGGVEVARRAPGGGFQQLSRAEAVSRSRVAPAAAPPPAPSAPVRSRYERLLGRSIID